MHEAGNAFLYGGECAVLVVLDNHAVYFHTLLVALRSGLPRVLLKRLHRKGYFAVLDFDNLHLHLVADLEEGARVFHEAPVELADVHESFKTLLELHEDAEINGARDFALYRIAHLVLVDERGLLFVFSAGAFREDELAFLRIRSDDADRERHAHELAEFAENLILISFRHAWVVLLAKLACRQEALDALPGEDEAALVRLFDDERVDRAGKDSLFRFAPDSRLAGFLE